MRKKTIQTARASGTGVGADPDAATRGHRSTAGVAVPRAGTPDWPSFSCSPREPMHGYQLMQAIGDRTGGRWTPSPGAIYPALNMLEDEGLVTVSMRVRAASSSP